MAGLAARGRRVLSAAQAKIVRGSPEFHCEQAPDTRVVFGDRRNRTVPWRGLHQMAFSTKPRSEFRSPAMLAAVLRSMLKRSPAPLCPQAPRGKPARPPTRRGRRWPRMRHRSSAPIRGRMCARRLGTGTKISRADLRLAARDIAAAIVPLNDLPWAERGARLT